MTEYKNGDVVHIEATVIKEGIAFCDVKIIGDAALRVHVDNIVKHIPKKIGVMDTVRIKGYEWGDFTVIAIDETRTGSVAWIKNNDNSYKSFSIDFLERV